jgi:hypothetical protein
MSNDTKDLIAFLIGIALLLVGVAFINCKSESEITIEEVQYKGNNYIIFKDGINTSVIKDSIKS